MSPRPYRLGARASGVSATRRRVITAARDLFVEGGFFRASMDEIASRADVARATVYHQFKSKLGVLEAVVADFEERAGLDALVLVIETAPPAQLLRSTITAGCGYWATDSSLVRSVLGVASMEPEVQALLDQHDAGRLRLLNRVLDRLEEAGLSRADCSRDDALDVLWLVTSFEAYDLLTRGRGLEDVEAADRLVEVGEHRLL